MCVLDDGTCTCWYVSTCVFQPRLHLHLYSCHQLRGNTPPITHSEDCQLVHRHSRAAATCLCGSITQVNMSLQHSREGVGCVSAVR